MVETAQVQIVLWFKYCGMEIKGNTKVPLQMLERINNARQVHEQLSKRGKIWETTIRTDIIHECAGNEIGYLTVKEIGEIVLAKE